MAEVKESKAQRVERLKREKLAWDHLDEAEQTEKEKPLNSSWFGFAFPTES